MNHPVLDKSHANPKAYTGIAMGALFGGLTVLLLHLDEPAAPATTRLPATGTAATLPPEGSTPAPLQPTELRAPLTLPPAPVPAVTTTAEMNQLADSNAPLEQKLAALAAVMRSPDSRMAGEAARRAVYLIKASDYPSHGAALLQDTTLSPSAMQVLGLNVHDRDVALTLPVLARIRDMSAHPLRAEAGDVLAFYLGADRASLTGPDLHKAVSDYLTERRVASRP